MRAVLPRGTRFEAHQGMGHENGFHCWRVSWAQVDKDDQGVLLQIFTKPLGDRSTIFVEIIQRLCPRRVTLGWSPRPVGQLSLTVDVCSQVLLQGRRAEGAGIRGRGGGGGRLRRFRKGQLLGALQEHRGL